MSTTEAMETAFNDVHPPDWWPMSKRDWLWFEFLYRLYRGEIDG